MFKIYTVRILLYDAITIISRKEPSISYLHTHIYLA
uniref:Uncharacterized protein n=1 Tax=Rhizophora mucronata TaxID=61149 RepID=A0A2P2PRP9_RHIMU